MSVIYLLFVRTSISICLFNCLLHVGIECFLFIYYDFQFGTPRVIFGLIQFPFSLYQIYKLQNEFQHKTYGLTKTLQKHADFQKKYKTRE